MAEFPEIWDAFKQGKWIRREIWRDGLAVRLCNIHSKKPGFVENWYSSEINDIVPVNMCSNDGFMFQFGSGIREKDCKPGLCPVDGFEAQGLQHDLLAIDWEIADQKLCNKLNKEEDDRGDKAFRRGKYANQ